MRYQPQHEANDDRPRPARPARPAWRWLAVVFVTGLSLGAWVNRTTPVKATVTRVEVVTREVNRPVLSAACRRAMAQADTSLADATALEQAFAQHLDMMDQLARNRATTRRALVMSMTTAAGAVASDRFRRALADYQAMTRTCAGAPAAPAPPPQHRPAGQMGGMRG